MTEAASLEARIARLEAESEIRKLKARYLNACDMKDVKVIRACFHPDAELDYAPMGKFGLDQLIAVFTQIAVGSPIEDSHQIHNGEIEIFDGGRAAARWSLSFTTYDPRSGSFRMMSGIYEDEYTKTGEGWRIMSSRHTPRLIVDGTLQDGAMQITPMMP
jgi:ketosteroid isomerase-like protein